MCIPTYISVAETLKGQNFFEIWISFVELCHKAEQAVLIWEILLIIMYKHFVSPLQNVVKLYFLHFCLTGNV